MSALLIHMVYGLVAGVAVGVPAGLIGLVATKRVKS